jgi:hypothetical protein
MPPPAPNPLRGGPVSIAWGSDSRPRRRFLAPWGYRSPGLWLLGLVLTATPALARSGERASLLIDGLFLFDGAGAANLPVMERVAVIQANLMAALATLAVALALHWLSGWLWQRWQQPQAGGGPLRGGRHRPGAAAAAGAMDPAGHHLGDRPQLYHPLVSPHSPGQSSGF